MKTGFKRPKRKLLLDSGQGIRETGKVMTSSAPILLITLSSDFGTRDGYAGAMKGVIRSVAPEVRLEDITHEIPPGDVRTGAWVLRTAVPFFPRGTVHVVVVDPGVGTARNAVVLQAESQYLIGPDNGVFSWIIREAKEVKAWKLSDDSWHPQQRSYTFHGRDLFAHAAALMVQEGDVSRVCGEEVVPRCDEWSRSYAVTPGVQGEVLHLDHFGNVVTNLYLADAQTELPGAVQIPSRDLVFDQLSRCYGDVEEGKALLLVGSHGFLEIAVRQGSAAEAFNLKPGDPVCVGP